MSQKRTQKQYTKEFKEEAVALVLEQCTGQTNLQPGIIVTIHGIYTAKSRKLV